MAIDTLDSGDGAEWWTSGEYGVMEWWSAFHSGNFAFTDWTARMIISVTESANQQISKSEYGHRYLYLIVVSVIVFTT